MVALKHIESAKILRLASLALDDSPVRLYVLYVCCFKFNNSIILFLNQIILLFY